MALKFRVTTGRGESHRRHQQKQYSTSYCKDTTRSIKIINPMSTADNKTVGHFLTLEIYQQSERIVYFCIFILVL
jgi:hypothetical protein